jgi:hypothetical protein
MAIKYRIVSTHITQADDVLIEFVCIHGKDNPVQGSLVVGSETTHEEIDDQLNTTVYNLATNIDEMKKIKKDKKDKKKAKREKCTEIKEGMDLKIGEVTTVHKP